MHSEELISKFEDIFHFNVIGHNRIDAHSIELELAEYDGVTFIFTWYNDRSFKLETK